MRKRKIIKLPGLKEVSPTKEETNLLKIFNEELLDIEDLIHDHWNETEMDRKLDIDKSKNKQ